MIIMAVLAPVLIMGMILMGAATIALAVTSVAAVGGLVVGISDWVFHTAAVTRAARKREIPDNVVAWPRPTARGGFADRQAWNSEQFGSGGRATRTAAKMELVPVSRAVSVDDYREQAVGFEPWEEVFPFDEPDFEQVLTYTLVAGIDF